MWRLYNYAGIANSLLTASELQIRKNACRSATALQPHKNNERRPEGRLPIELPLVWEKTYPTALPFPSQDLRLAPFKEHIVNRDTNFILLQKRR